MAKECDCNADKEKSGCAACPGFALDPFWCDTCKRPVPEKRCRYCGLKARKVRDADPR